MSQEELGQRVGVSLRTIGNWERGATVPRARVAVLLDVLAAHIEPTGSEPETSESGMGNLLWAVVEPYRVSWLAQQVGVSPQVIYGWRDRPLRDIPSPRILHALAHVTETPYEDVFTAAAVDAGYLPADSATRAESTRPGSPPLDSGIPARRAHGPSRSGGRGAAGTSRDDTASGS